MAAVLATPLQAIRRMVADVDQQGVRCSDKVQIVANCGDLLRAALRVTRPTDPRSYVMFESMGWDYGRRQNSTRGCDLLHVQSYFPSEVVIRA
ncbi:unnamed protein product [Urochloa humidicola]